MSDGDGGDESWAISVESWSLSVSETFERSSTTDGSSSKITHSASGTLTKSAYGTWDGDLSVAEFQRDVSAAPYTITTVSGSETWSFELGISDSTYVLSVDGGSWDVPGQVVAPYTGQKTDFVTSVPWVLFDAGVSGDLPTTAQAISGELSGDGGEGSLTWTLTPGASQTQDADVEPPLQPQPVTIVPGAPPTKGPSAPPRKPRKNRQLPQLPNLPDLLVKLYEKNAGAAEASAYLADCQKVGCPRCVAEWLTSWSYLNPDQIPDNAWDDLHQIAVLGGSPICARHTVPLGAGVALYLNIGASAAGHVACAIEIPQPYMDYYQAIGVRSGANAWVEGKWAIINFTTQGRPIGPSDLSVGCVPSPQQYFRDQEYSLWRSMRSRQGRFELALVAAAGFGGSIYRLIGNNCADAAFSVLTAFGVDLPRVGQIPGIGIRPPDLTPFDAPMNWFWELPGTPMVLRKLTKAQQATWARMAQANAAQVADTDEPDEEDLSAEATIGPRWLRSELKLGWKAAWPYQDELPEPTPPPLPSRIFVLERGASVYHYRKDCEALEVSTSTWNALDFSQPLAPDMILDGRLRVCQKCLNAMQNPPQSALLSMRHRSKQLDVYEDRFVFTTCNWRGVVKAQVCFPVEEIVNVSNNWKSIVGPSLAIKLPDGPIYITFASADRRDFARDVLQALADRRKRPRG